LGLSLELTTNRRGKDFRRGRWMNWVASPVATPGFKLKYRVTAGNWFMWLTDNLPTAALGSVTVWFGMMFWAPEGLK
jgi:hypothetical protein